MSSIRRILSNSVAPRSLCICVALAIIWPRTLHRSDKISYVTQSGTTYEIESVPRSLEFVRATHYQQWLTEEGLQFFATPSGWSMASIIYDVPFGPPAIPSTPPATQISNAAVNSTMQGTFSFVVSTAPTPSRFLGFAIACDNLSSATNNLVQTSFYMSMATPFWFLILMTSIPPFAWLGL
jgi:hypothetical protein